MEQVLRQIYVDVSNGKLSRQEALEKIKALKLHEESAGVLAVVAVWQASDLAAAHQPEYADRQVIAVPSREGKNAAEHYRDAAVTCFDRIQAILKTKPQGKVLVQIVGDEPLLAGLSGLLKTAALENPQFFGQIILVSPVMTAEERARVVHEEQARGVDPVVRYEGGVREILRWQEVGGEQDAATVAFKDDGVYLITGGLGALGLLFAREIHDRTQRGRVVLSGRSELTAEKRALLEALPRATYQQSDPAVLGQVEQLIAAIRSDYGRLDGILHAAGMIADNFILKKTSAEFIEVLTPKVAGTFHLDHVTRDLELDFFVLFSSFAGAMGNVGQADYAAANGFLDQFAAYRNRQVTAGHRHGRTRSINWPLWQSGGMRFDPASLDVLQQTTGAQPMQTTTGLRAFHRSLAITCDQLLVVEGNLPRMRSALLAVPAPSAEPKPKQQATLATIDVERLASKTREFLCAQFSGVLKLPASQIDPEAALEQYGIDSIVAMKLTTQLEQTFGPLSKTLFFEYQTVATLTEYFVESHAPQLTVLFQPPSAEALPEVQQPAARAAAVANRRPARPRSVAPQPAGVADPIAIIGLSGRYPEAVDVEAYWQNLRNGKDCIVEVPRDRWDWREYFSDDRTQSGSHYSKWGGFIAGVDEFDPLFFNISPKEAKLIDPQERLFLQHAWMAVEDAGYTRAALQVPSDDDLAGQVGVYVGLMYTEYQLFGAEASAQGKRLGIVGSASSIANRVSYALNLHGPSMTLDTMCSSSLTAIHLACQDLKQGRTSLAIAGGVNVSIHPNKYLVLSSGQFISSDGHCQSFGEGGDGYIPGEGVGVVILKRLSEAERDGDHIYGVIRGSALNHGGKTNGVTVPNPHAQASAINRALAESHTDARHISYIEAHGTGTKLGDPIEIAALNRAFSRHTKDTGFCLIGSAKSNIGHCESAAGIAGLTKVLLQLQHQEIVPSLHSAQLNPHIDFGKSPFIVNQELRPWEQPVIDGRKLPRIAGISSFGAGGSNAHVLIEEYQAPVRHHAAAGEVIVPLSARTPEQLQQKARDLLSFVGARVEALDLGSLAYTLQAGREPMEERLAFVVQSVAELSQKLAAYVAGDPLEGVHQGQVKRNREALSVFSTDSDLQQTVEKWIDGRKLAKLADLWVKGLELDWRRLSDGQVPQRISLPTYPFAKERYWIDVAAIGRAAAQPVAAAVLHPLLHSNTSDFSQQSYSSTFNGSESFLKEGTLPPAAYLEMARAAVENATRAPGDASIELRDVVWSRPFVAAAGAIRIALFTEDHAQIEWEIYSEDADGENVHCHGRAIVHQQAATPSLDPSHLEPPLVRLRLPNADDQTFRDYLLDPVLLDQALQATRGTNHTGVLATLQSLRIFVSSSAETLAWIRPGAGGQTVDVDLCDERGNVSAQLRGLEWQETRVEVAVPVVAPPRVRREIAFVPDAESATPVAVDRKKRAPLSLTAPAVTASSATASAPARARITLTRTAASAPATASGTPVISSIRMFDEGDGVFSIDVAASVSGNAIAHLQQALDRIQQQSSLKALILIGIEHAFGRGGREEYNEAVERNVYRKLAAFPYPVIAVLQGDTAGAACIAAALCDFLVFNEEASYSYADVQSGLFPTVPVAALFHERFGRPQGDDFLYFSDASTGRALRAKGWTSPIVPAGEVAAHARELASALTTKSQDALRLLKQHLMRHLSPLVSALAPLETTSNSTGRSSDAIAVIPCSEAVHDLAADLSRYRGIVLTGDGVDIPDDDVAALQRRLLGLEIPVVAALPAGAKGNAWLVAQFCDACVYSRSGSYSAPIAPALEQMTVGAFTLRFGNDAGRELLLTGGEFSGADLQQRIGTAIIAEPDGVLPAAMRIAERLAALPRPTLAAWKQQTAAALDQQVRTLSVSAGQEDAANAPSTTVTEIPLRSSVVTATAHPEGIVVVRMEDREARNMFSEAFIEGVTEAFAHVERTPGYKVVVLTGYDNYFAAGGTKESLLAIQEGKAKFTDVNVFQLPLDCKLPVIAAMQGHGVGAGWSMGMFADLVLMSEESRYVSPYMNYGFTPGAGATWTLADKLGSDLARESLFTARYYTGSELKARGVRLAILPRSEVLPAAMALATRIAKASRQRLINLKRLCTQYVREALQETYRLELAMHEKTFVGQSDTLARIQTSFDPELEARTPVAAPVVPTSAPRHASAAVIQPAARSATADVLPAVMATLRTLLASELQMREEDVDDQTQFVDLGLDSISGVTWIRKINEKYQTSIEATKVYSYPTLAELSKHVREEAEKQGTLSVPLAAAAVEPAVLEEVVTKPVVAARTARRNRVAPRTSTVTSAPAPARRPEPIAIVGMAGQFPLAKDLDQFWQNLSEGRNCITEVSRRRWDVDAYYQPGDPVAGKSNSQWLGALEEYDQFDPLFFNISPTEAEFMDPQQRLFLQACWHSIENAGYDARTLSGSKCGVFVGCAAGDYQQLSRRHQLSAQGFTGNAVSILAARISYFLNLQGPCVSIDTACSSSLVAMAQACDSLTSGDSDLALAGGVYVMAGPEMHIRTAQAGMLSPEGKCFTFDERANGFVPGEAVGVVVLKRLADAQRDGDIIHGLMEGWGVNQDGKTNGITAPNPESQTRLMRDVYEKYAIDPVAIQLIEAHGTATKLGDPIEIEGLKTSFRNYTAKKDYCALGSVKSNIGHCLTAAGIAGVIKLLLALKHKQLPPTINFERLNEHIDLTDSPFFVNDRLQEWKLNGAPRRLSAISSFGFSGTNAHIVIGDYDAPARVQRSGLSKVIVPLSARTAEQLRQKARDLVEFLRKDAQSTSLADIAHTLQAGRQPMEERLGFVVTSADQLTGKLQAFLAGDAEIEDAFQGQAKRGKASSGILGLDADLKKTIVDKWIAEEQLAKVLELWVGGLDLDWSLLYGAVKPQRVSLPGYPFANEHYWIAIEPDEPAASGGSSAVLHPLLHSNTSDLSGQRFTSTFSGKEAFLVDQSGRKVLPAAACLEMARAAIERALPSRRESTVLELRDTVWAQPIFVGSGLPFHISIAASGNDEVAFEIYSREGERDVVYCQGRAAISDEQVPPIVDPEQRKAEGQRLVALGLRNGTAGDYVLDPALLDAAFQAAAPDRVPAALTALTIFSPCNAATVVWVRGEANGDIDLCDAGGRVCVQLRGLSSRAGEQRQTVASLIAAPAWQASDRVARSSGYVEHHVLVCDLPHVNLASALPDAQCLSLNAAQSATIAQRYTDFAVSCFERVQTILASKPQGEVLFQVVVADEREQVLLAGVSGLLKTASLENPQFTGEVILIAPQTTAEDLGRQLAEEKGRVPDALIRYSHGTREVLRWNEVPTDRDDAPIAFRNGGVYLITGGLGLLGTLFAKEILQQTANATIVLTGRAAATPETSARLAALPANVRYRQVDLADGDDVQRLVSAIREEHGRLDGILHCAGVTADSFVVNKGSAEFRQVLEPKVTGTLHLDDATAGLELDFFVLFSSIAGALGNLGQSDYATANAFLDQFAAHRNRQVAANQRHGRTRSINWPLWQAGGMAIDAASQELVRQTMGVEPMQTVTGLEAFYRSLALPYDQTLIAEGNRQKIAAYLRKVRIFEPAAPVANSASQEQPAVSSRQLQQEVRQLVAAVVGIEPSIIDADQPFSEFGLDSFLGAELIVSVNKRYGTDLSHSRLFDYSTVREFSQFLEQELVKLPATAAEAPLASPAVERSVEPVSAPSIALLRKNVRGSRTATRGEHSDEKIAVIGMSGRYPKAADLNQYWENLVAGRNAIGEVPSWRWDVDHYFDATRGTKDKTYSKWLGALDDIDRFDPLFFRISPQEAEYMDPQHRLFLQESYRAFEDAGYSTGTLTNRKCGVYLGISTNEYMSLLSRNGIISAPVTSNSSAIAAARIAYYLNLKGPAISVDTACSSSLVAIHLASQALLNHETDMAVAGGVTLWLAPESYVAMSQAGMFSPNGQCKTFDDSADGIVNGEGVGAVVLKRLSDAQADGDVIYGVILGSGINQDGRTNGITAPSVNSQIDLERGIYARHQIDPESIGYIETHGTGTRLGDPIELEALATVFKEKTAKKNFCALGSVKSNIGHTTSAAGVAGLQKVLLSMRNRTFVPSLNVTKENSRFDFQDSPFYISRETKAWDVAPGSLRRAAVSSFGFSGTNAHLVVEEYPNTAAHETPIAEQGPFLIPLSARAPEQLRQKVSDLREFLRTAPWPLSPASVAYTLQVGREPMEERLGFVVSSVEELTEKLAAYADGAKAIEGMHYGRVEPGSEGMTTIGGDDDMQEAIEKWIARKKLTPLLDLWTRGLNFDWNKLHSSAKPPRINLPAYPFARERCWIDETSASRAPMIPIAADSEMQSIEDILNQIENDTIDTGHAVQALKMLV
jgi:acyl transferase domain-containing protein/enoyl-CoA hydratase/carnithine racemase/acyl carrier protein